MGTHDPACNDPPPGDDRPPCGDPPSCDEEDPQQIPQDALETLQERLLKSPTRQSIFDRLETNPGSNLTQLADHVGINRNALTHHLEKFEKHDLIKTLKSPRGTEKLVFLTRHKRLYRKRQTLILYGNSSQRPIAQIILQQPGVTSREIANAVDTHPGSVREHITQLREEYELVEHISQGRTLFHYPTQALQTWQDDLEEITTKLGLTEADD